MPRASKAGIKRLGRCQRSRLLTLIRVARARYVVFALWLSVLGQHWDRVAERVHRTLLEAFASLCACSSHIAGGVWVVVWLLIAHCWRRFCRNADDNSTSRGRFASAVDDMVDDECVACRISDAVFLDVVDSYVCVCMFVMYVCPLPPPPSPRPEPGHMLS